MKRLTTQVFIERSSAMHGGKYGYDKAEYKNRRSLVTITCPVHGDFVQNSEQHMTRGHGCPKCAGVYRYKDIGEWEQSYRSKYPGCNLTFENAVYSGNKSKITATCQKHGCVKKSPDQLMASGGCPKCNISKRVASRRLDTESVLKRFKLAHGNKYDYSKVIYINRRTKVEVVCRVHGSFFALAIDHINGSGCSECYGNNTKTIEEWVEGFQCKFPESKLIFDKTQIVSKYEKMDVECPVHGVFKKSRQGLLRTGGCPMCASYGFNISKPAILYYAKVMHFGTELWKIGITNRNFKERYCSDDLSKMQLVKVFNFEKGLDARLLESELKVEFSKYIYSGKDTVLKSADGNTELFTVDILGMKG